MAKGDSKRVICGTCGGTGKVGGLVCWPCQGTGATLMGRTARSTSERDPFEYRSVFDGYRESKDFHDWTDLATAEDEAEVFRGLGCKNVRIEKRRRYRGDADLGGFLAWAKTASGN